MAPTRGMSSQPRFPGKDGARRLFVVLRSSGRHGVLAAATRCLKRLVPDASVVFAPASPPPGAEAITLDAEEVAAGSLTAASALERERAAAEHARRRRP
jgi:hypothetical protein